MRLLMGMGLLLWLALGAASQPAVAEVSQVRWDERATRHYASIPLGLHWQNELGDWIDAADQAQGDQPFAEQRVKDRDRQQFVHWDITSLVAGWLGQSFPNQGLLLRGQPDSRGKTKFLSREAEGVLMPLLILYLQDGTEQALEAQYDTFLTPNSRKPQGDQTLLSVGKSEFSLLYFELPEEVTKADLVRAELFLATNAKQYGDNLIGVYRVAADEPSPVRMGLAATYDHDQGLGAHPQVIFSERFESGRALAPEWYQIRDPHSVETLQRYDGVGFQPLDGAALSIKFSPSAHTALSMALPLQHLMGQEPEALYFRYYLRLGNDWNSDRGGGKLPGFGGTYGKAGWGGRKPDGRNGWSARGLFKNTVKQGPHLGKTPIGSYLYHADHGDKYGDPRTWGRFESLLEKNRWYSIEQYLQLNTPGLNDGVVKAWVDGRLVTEIDGIRFRDTAQLKIETIWFDFYHGGAAKPSSEQHLFIDNVVVAREYIGPMKSP